MKDLSNIFIECCTPYPRQASYYNMFEYSFFVTMQALKETVSYLSSLDITKAETAVVLGSGLGGLVDSLHVIKEIPYKDIPHFPVSTVAGHQGKLIYARLEDKYVLAMQGRFHFYEGYSMQEVVFPIRVMKMLGIKNLILTNAAGCLNLQWKLGDLMVFDDHINLMPANPLIGVNNDELGPRFPPMNDAYDLSMQHQLIEIAAAEGIILRKGVYAAVTGPNYETRAEYRYLRTIGADAVGMSTVPEVITARHMGMNCLAISVLTDICDPDSIQKIDHAEVIQVANESGKQLSKLLLPLLKHI